MDLTFSATHEALEQYDAVDGPALDAMRRKMGGVVNVWGFDEARKRAADKVRAAFLVDTGDVNTEENVELMSIEKIRDATESTVIGRLLGLLP